jgi:hypothetical protein
MALPFSSIPTIEQVLAAKQTGFVVFNVNGKIYQQIICGGCPDCQQFDEVGNVVCDYPHYQTKPEEVR